MAMSLQRGRGIGAWTLVVIAVATAAFGVMVALYASLALADELGSWRNPYAWPRRVIQFVFACGVPLAATVAARAALVAARGDAPLRRGVVALAIAAASFALWLVAFLDWRVET